MKTFNLVLVSPIIYISNYEASTIRGEGIRRRNGRTPCKPPNKDLQHHVSTHSSYRYYFLLLLPLLLASPTSASPTYCGKYPYIYLSFYLPFKQDKLGLCILYLLCPSAAIVDFLYYIDFSYFQDNAG